MVFLFQACEPKKACSVFLHIYELGEMRSRGAKTLVFTVFPFVAKSRRFQKKRNFMEFLALRIIGCLGGMFGNISIRSYKPQPKVLKAKPQR